MSQQVSIADMIDHLGEHYDDSQNEELAAAYEFYQFNEWETGFLSNMRKYLARYGDTAGLSTKQVTAVENLYLKVKKHSGGTTR